MELEGCSVLNLPSLTDWLLREMSNSRDSGRVRFFLQRRAILTQLLMAEPPLHLPTGWALSSPLPSVELVPLLLVVSLFPVLSYWAKANFFIAIELKSLHFHNLYPVHVVRLPFRTLAFRRLRALAALDSVFILSITANQANYYPHLNPKDQSRKRRGRV